MQVSFLLFTFSYIPLPHSCFVPSFRCVLSLPVCFHYFSLFSHSFSSGWPLDACLFCRCVALKKQLEKVSPCACMLLICGLMPSFLHSHFQSKEAQQEPRSCFFSSSGYNSGGDFYFFSFNCCNPSNCWISVASSCFAFCVWFIMFSYTFTLTNALPSLCIVENCSRLQYAENR
jgi:hypothetical protein